jgi:hypothetical protein
MPLLSRHTANERKPANPFVNELSNEKIAGTDGLPLPPHFVFEIKAGKLFRSLAFPLATVLLTPRNPRALEMPV